MLTVRIGWVMGEVRDVSVRNGIRGDANADVPTFGRLKFNNHSSGHMTLAAMESWRAVVYFLGEMS